MLLGGGVCIRSVLQPSPPSICTAVASCKLELCPHQTRTPGCPCPGPRVSVTPGAPLASHRGPCGSVFGDRQIPLSRAPPGGSTLRRVSGCPGVALWCGPHRSSVRCRWTPVASSWGCEETAVNAVGTCPRSPCPQLFGVRAREVILFTNPVPLPPRAPSCLGPQGRGPPSSQDPPWPAGGGLPLRAPSTGRCGVT